MKKVFFLASLMGLLFTADMSFAQGMNRQHNRNQERRIQQGIRQGDLTRGEIRHIRQLQERLRFERRMALADGHITLRERRKIAQAEDRLNRAIYNQRHNRFVRR